MCDHLLALIRIGTRAIGVVVSFSCDANLFFPDPIESERTNASNRTKVRLRAAAHTPPGLASAKRCERFFKGKKMDFLWQGRGMAGEMQGDIYEEIF
ncbi:hypothetical protein EJD96_14060 [Herbaspirillum seropedicae]|uniref:hypothetical protein n=1 Tax=Herbaspirillum seropedicae TaxID=964 RepID=UPI00111DC4CC|nr:hypothetical protein [Herbaspirillum seropedicae]QDD65205.1 hypothetical protein EJD96_14060 [Herbaspirillum seropedicae]